MSVENFQKHIRSFGRCAAGTSRIYVPKNVDEVNQVFDIARQAKPQGRIAIRGGGHSFDGQALHDQDTGAEIVLSSRKFDSTRIDFNPASPDTVTLGAGVQWGDFVTNAIAQSKASNGPIRIPGSMQTGRASTVAGTLSGDCLSRFSGTGGKESKWIESFRILTPTSGTPFEVTEASDPDLFHSVIGGMGYIGFVTDATYRLISIENASIARSTITTHQTFHSLIQRQLQLVTQGVSPRAISSAWFTELIPGILPTGLVPNPLDLDILNPDTIKGAVFDSSFAQPSDPQLPGFPLYDDIHSGLRYWVEVLLAREDLTNLLVHEFLFNIIRLANGRFENDLLDFLFFMDGNTIAKKTFEAINPGWQFPIVQQTYVIPTAQTEAFALNCMRKMRSLKYFLRPTECDMLYVAQDECFMSASYHLDGFAVTIGFEPLSTEGCPPAKIPQLLRELSEDCFSAGGRIHTPKNLDVNPTTFRKMFPKITAFEDVKRKHDPEHLLRNPFSDTFFQF